MMTDKPKKVIEVGRDLGGLSLRRRLCKAIILTIDEMPKDVEGRESAITEYKRQLASIDKKIEEITGTPPPVTVGLKTASLSGKAGLG